jgi:cellulose 1,4-beta-cellobiosidase
MGFITYFITLASYAYAAINQGSVQPNSLLSFPISIDGKPIQTQLTLDANWRWAHSAADLNQNCFPSSWNKGLCPDPLTCASNCVVEGISQQQWINPYGASVTGNAVRLNYLTRGQYGDNVGSRLYIVDPSGQQYYNFNFLNKDFVFTVDVSHLPCGTNGALYSVAMPLAGLPNLGAAYGSGYCDAQCPSDIKWMGSGWANTNSSGVCCSEFDFWEANQMATQMTGHTCKEAGLVVCDNDVDCGNGGNRYNAKCDKDGGDVNPYRNGDRAFYGPGPNFKVDTTKRVEVHTEFITVNGDLSQIHRYYVQNGKQIEGFVQTDATIAAQKQKYGENNYFGKLGGMKAMGEALKQMTLVLSIWDDSSPAQMKWLDSVYPPEGGVGSVRGPCPTTGQDPATLRRLHSDAYVVYSNIQLNTLSSKPPSPPSPPQPQPSPSPSSGKWQCMSCVKL